MYTTLKQAADSVYNGEAFVSNSMSARWVHANSYVGMGELPESYRKQLRKVLDDLRDSPNRMIYIVWSYGTPVAWCRRTTLAGGYNPDSWVIPDVKYSVTTSRHQNIVRRNAR